MKKILYIAIICIFTFSFTAYSVGKNIETQDINKTNIQTENKKLRKDNKFLKKCTDDCMSKKTRCNKEGNKEKTTKKMMHTRGFCDSNFRNCNLDCNSRYGKKR